MTRSEIFAALGSFLIIGIVFGWIAIQTNPVALWMAPAFSGWVAAVASNFSSGLVLYADGGHLPMSPLPFVLVYLIAQGEPLWVHGKLLSHLFMVLTSVTFFFATARVFAKPSAFLASVLVLMLMISKQGFLLYNYMAFFIAAVCMALAVSLASVEPDNERSHTRFVISATSRRAFLLGITAITCILSKQSIGIGAFLGCGAVLLFYPRWLSLPRRAILIVVYLTGSALAFAGWCVILNSFIDPSGMVVDVFLTGSETKGGLSGSVRRLFSYIGALGHWLPVWYPNGSDFRAHLYFIPAALLLLLLWATSRNVPAGQAFSNNPRPRLIERLMVLSAIATVALILLSGQMGIREVASVDDGTIPAEIDRFHLTGFIFWFLHIYLFASIFPAVRVRLSNALGIDQSALLVLVLFSYPTLVVGHLSMPKGQLYFHYFGLHLVFVGAALFLSAAFALCSKLHNSSLRVAAQTGIWLGVIAISVFLYLPNYMLRLDADQVWPEIESLDGVLMLARHNEYLSVIRRIRELAPNKSDEVLMLPNAPMFESFVERQRPDLSSAIVFMDTYQDRYVDDDLLRIEKSLPKVIVIGPRPETWQINFVRGKFSGTLQLILRLERTLLPDRYRLADTFDIHQGRVQASIAVYERQDVE